MCDVFASETAWSSAAADFTSFSDSILTDISTLTSDSPDALATTTPPPLDTLSLTQAVHPDSTTPASTLVVMTSLSTQLLSHNSIILSTLLSTESPGSDTTHSSPEGGLSTTIVIIISLTATLVGCPILLIFCCGCRAVLNAKLSCCKDTPASKPQMKAPKWLERQRRLKEIANSRASSLELVSSTPSSMDSNELMPTIKSIKNKRRARRVHPSKTSQPVEPKSQHSDKLFMIDPGSGEPVTMNGQTPSSHVLENESKKSENNNLPPGIV